MTLRTPAVLAVLATLVLAACGGDDGESASAAADGGTAKPADLSKVKLRVGVQKDGIRAVLERTGALKGAPYQVEFSTFQFGPPLVEAAGADKIDLAWVGSTPPIFGAAAGSDFKIIGTVKEADAQENTILVPKDSPIQRVEDLKGKKVAVPKGSSAHGLLLNALNRVGLSGKDIQFVFLPPADGLAAFSKKAVDAWVVWDPFTIQAKQELGARGITGGEPDEHGYGFEIASSKALEDDAKKAAIQDYVGRLQKAWAWASTHPDEWGDAWAKESGLSPKVTRATARVKASEIVPVDDQIIERQQALADLLAEEKVLPSAVDFKSIVDTSILDLSKEGAAR
jgi:sulfonate transport system substrate-binding protein